MRVRKGGKCRGGAYPQVTGILVMPRKTQPASTLAGRGVQAQVRDPLEECRHGDLGDLGPGDPGAGAEVHAAAEAQVRLLGAEDVEGLGVLEDLRVAVGGAEHHAEPGALGQVHALKHHVLGGFAGVHANGGHPAHGFLEGHRMKLGVVLHGFELLGMVQQGPDGGGKHVAWFVQPAADGHFQVGADGLERDGHGGEPGEQRVVGVLGQVREHLVDGGIDLGRGSGGLGPDLRVVGVVAGSVDHGLAPALQVFLRGVVEAADQPQVLRGVGGRIVPDEVSARALGEQLAEVLLVVGGEDLVPVLLDGSRAQRGTVGVPVHLVLRVVLAQHRVAHGALHQRVVLVGGEAGLVLLDFVAGGVGSHHVAVDRRDPVDRGLGSACAGRSGTGSAYRSGMVTQSATGASTPAHGSRPVPRLADSPWQIPRPRSAELVCPAEGAGGGRGVGCTHGGGLLRERIGWLPSSVSHHITSGKVRVIAVYPRF